MRVFTQAPHTGATQLLDDEQHWYKDAVVYQLHVRAFQDASEDGIGDFRGLVQKLDYLQDLGVTALWLLPFYPSPLRDDGYDIADFTAINPSYGTMREFRSFLREAHGRGLKVITELVVNHTSDQHPWFQRARRSPPGSRWRNFYVWADTPERYADARIIFQDFESSNWNWDPVAKAYYWHRFYSHQPDLNYESADVRRLVMRALDFWLRIGVDGLRLDAVPYLYERDGTSCENLPETHAFLQELRARVDERFAGRMLLAEANQWPEDAAAYFGQGDECHMAFHFPVMPRLFMAVQMEDRFPIIDILQQTPTIPETCQWALFLRNHDELTLEMVTDEERDYMYRVYAHDRQTRINLGIRRRLAPLLGNNRAKIELLNGLLLSLPGTPVLYYGDEIGMGDNVYLGDRDGVRTPMQWSGDRNAGFSRANPQRLFLPPIIDPEFHYETVNVESQLQNPHSLLWWMRRLIALRGRHRVFGRGELEFLHPENSNVLAFLRRSAEETILVIANLSRFAQYVELDLSEFRGRIPVELFGQTSFPTIGELPYLLTLGPHDFYWFQLDRSRADLAAAPADGQPPRLSVRRQWSEALEGADRSGLEQAVRIFLLQRRWFAGKARTIHSLHVGDVIRLSRQDDERLSVFALVEVHYREGEPETYVLPLVVAPGERGAVMREEAPEMIVAELVRGDETAILHDGMADDGFCEQLLEVILRRRRLRAPAGTVVGRPTSALRSILAEEPGGLEPGRLRAEQSNTCVVFGHRLIMKLFRRIESGTNPDLEIGRFLTEQLGFEQTPAVAGAIEYEREAGEHATLAIVHELVPNEGDAWEYTRNELGRLYENWLTGDPDPEIDTPARVPAATELVNHELPETLRARCEGLLRSAELIGQRTAELHRALASVPHDPAFAPEPFTALYQRSAYQSMRNLAQRSLAHLRRGRSRLGERERTLADRVLDSEGALLERLRAMLEIQPTGLRIRYHGDFHLGQVLYTGRDFLIIDFEGEPARSFADRRIKRSAIRDVAGMLRSFDYARHAALSDLADRGSIEVDSHAYDELERVGAHWIAWISASYLRAYLEAAVGSAFLPDTREEFHSFLRLFLIEKALYELGYELNSRPDWVRIPLSGILELAELDS